MEATLPKPDSNAFEAWCSSQGIFRAKVRYGSASDSAAGLGLFARDDIALGEEFLSVPVGATITEETARESEVGRVVAEENAARDAARAGAAAAGASSGGAVASAAHRISPRTLFYLFLIHARHSLTSPWRPWLVHAVPRSYDLPLTWSAEEQALLRGSNLGEAVPHRLAQLRRRHANALPALTKRAPQLFRADVFTFENFLWAHGTYSSRGFPAQLVDPSLAPNSGSTLPGAVVQHADADASAGPAMSLGAATVAFSSAVTNSPRSSYLGCLIPYLDLTNHRFRQPITWLHSALPTDISSAAPLDATKLHPHDRSLRAAALASGVTAAALPALQPRVSLRAGQHIRAGEEILNNYGAKANEELLMGYGFTLPGNEADEVTVALAEAAVSPEKRAILRGAGIKLHQYLRRGAQSIPTSLLQLMRACAMDEQALQECSALWLPFAVPELLGSAPSEDAAAGLRQYLSTPHPRLELSMLHTLRSLLLGRLRRLQLYDEHLHASIPVERALVASSDAAASSAASASSSQQVHTLSADFFSRFTATDLQLRDANRAASPSNYRVECALNYRIGQREVLMDAVTQVDQLISAATAAASARLSAVEVLAFDVAAAANAAPASVPSAKLPESKKRKTGRSGSAAASASSSASSWFVLLQQYSAWLESVGGEANADWSTGVWTARSAVEATPSPVAKPLLRLPLSALITQEAIEASTSFAPCLSAVQGLEEPQVALLFLLHERAKGADSRWHAWLQCISAGNEDVSSAAGEDEIAPSSLAPAEAALYDLYSQLFPNLCEALPDVFPQGSVSWHRFRWAADIVQSHRVEVRLQATGALVGAVLPVPVMPALAPVSLSVLEVMHAPAAEPASAVSSTSSASRSKRKQHSSSGGAGSSGAMLVLRSLIPLVVGATATFAAPTSSVWPDLVSHGRQLLTAARDGMDAVVAPLPCATLLELHQELLEAQQISEGESPPCGLPLQPMTRVHHTVWARCGVDESTTFVRTARQPVSALLKAVVRSFFLSLAHLRPSVGAADGDGDAKKQCTASLTGALVDDSDEEEESSGAQPTAAMDHREDEEDEEDESEEPEEGATAATMPDESLLRVAVSRLLQQLHRTELDQVAASPDVPSSAQDSGASSSAPRVRLVSASHLNSAWLQQQRALLLSALEASRLQ